MGSDSIGAGGATAALVAETRVAGAGWPDESSPEPPPATAVRSSAAVAITVTASGLPWRRRRLVRVRGAVGYGRHMLIGYAFSALGGIVYTVGTVLVMRLNTDRRVPWWGKFPRQDGRTVSLRFVGALLFVAGSMLISRNMATDGILVPAIRVGLLVLVATAPAMCIQAVHNRAVAEKHSVP
ncbi:hypothetical protein [Rhodococcus sp. NPDC058521]|uniref:hypothetical protein n=1 Tax=Rhodococcus sp. NPDC058521 TaxID=3346536 RepID=UPI003659050F